MSSILFLTAIALFGQSQEGPDLWDHWWDVGLTGKVVSVLESENRLGQLTWWIPEAKVQVEEENGELLVRVRADVPYGHFHEIELRLQERGMEARVRHDSGPVTEVSGVACLFTDTETAALDFELYPFGDHFLAQPYFGRVQLGASSVALARELAERELAGSSLFASAQSVALGATGESRGWKDGFGRRQGVWTRRENGVKRGEATWSNGRPHGRWAIYDEEGRLRFENSFRDGLQHGESYQWYENGDLGALDRYVDGYGRGLRVVFHPSGAKKLEYAWESGIGKSWNEEGRLIGERSFHQAAWTNTPEWREAHARFLGEVARLWTRNGS